MRKEKENPRICSSKQTSSHPAFQAILTRTTFLLLNIKMFGVGMHGYQRTLYEGVKEPHGESEESVMLGTVLGERLKK